MRLIAFEAAADLAPVVPLLGAILGLLVGSYLATLVMRLPQARSATWGRSRCDGCARTLSWFELVPLVSFAVLKGRCRTCGMTIDARHLQIELGAALIGAVALAVHPGIDGLFGAVFGWGLLTLAILDAEHFWLPDTLTLPLAAAGLISGLAVDPSLLDRLIGLIGGYGVLAGVAAVYRIARQRQGLGGGDPKLLAAIGAWLGWQALPFVLLLAAAIGLGVAVLWTVRGVPVTRTTRLPFGTLMAIAAWTLWLIDPMRFLS